MPASDARRVQYVLQVGSKETPTEALVVFSDMEQKYGSLLAGYHPHETASGRMIHRAVNKNVRAATVHSRIVTIRYAPPFGAHDI
jgi:hypothetical protein